MASGRFVQEYQKGAVNGASPLQLVIMLYDGALRFMEAGKAAMALGELERQNHSLQKAQRIVAELMSCLDMNQGGEIAQNLMGIYVFVHEELIHANMQDDSRRLDACIKIIGDLRQTWGELASSLQGSETAQELQDPQHGQPGLVEKRSAAA